MLILGVDPGSRFTGFGVIEKLQNRIRYVESLTLDISKIEQFAEKLKIISERLLYFLDKYQIDYLALEKIFHALNSQSAFKLAQVRGVILLQSANYQIPVFEFNPKEVKSAVSGNGNANKIQVKRMVNLLLNFSKKLSDDESDALALALSLANNNRLFLANKIL